MAPRTTTQDIMSIIRAAMAEQQITQAEMSRYLNCDAGKVARMLDGRITRIEIERLAKMLEKCGLEIIDD